MHLKLKQQSAMWHLVNPVFISKTMSFIYLIPYFKYLDYILNNLLNCENMNPEKEINLSVLQQRDPYITSISDSASQVAIYSFNSEINEWEKTHVEGTLFVYNRSAHPLNGFMVINRLDPRDLIEPIDQNLEFKLQDHFLLYRNAKGNIIGIWFYDENECIKIDKLLNSLVRSSIRQRMDAMRPRGCSESEPVIERAEPMVSNNSDANIMQMLYKAQNEYDKVKLQTSLKKSSTAPNNQLTTKNPILKDPNGGSNLTQNNLESLFLKLSTQHDNLKLNQNSGENKLKRQEISQQVSINESSKLSLPITDSAKNKFSDQNNLMQNIPPTSSFSKSSSCARGQMLNEVEKTLKNKNPVLDANDGLSQFHFSQLPIHCPASSNSLQPQKSSPATVIQQLAHSQLTSQNNKFPVNSLITSLSNNIFKDNVLSSLSRINIDQENYLLKPNGCNSNLNGPMGIVGEKSRSNGSSLKGETLLSAPDKFSSSSNINDSLVSGNVLLSPMVFQSLPANKKTKNISPNFDGDQNIMSASVTVNQNENVNPLTKQQFQLALINLLKNDSNFLNRLHEAYVSCLNTELLERN